MRSTPAILTILSFLLKPLLAEQSATFSSQATQGWAWQASAEVTAERIAITILPDHLDVEHELEIRANSTWNTPSHPNSLEILGRLNLSKGAVVTGLLLWNGRVILKGKLQTKAMARRKYEEVVDRNVKDPPPPRDPALLEKIGEDAYALSIFPVVLNGSRKVRIRYLVPSSFKNGAHRISFPHAFSSRATLTLKGGPGIAGYAVTSERMDGTESTVKNEDAVAMPLSLDRDAYQQFRPRTHWETGSGAWLHHITPLFGKVEGSQVCAGSMRDTKGTPGHVAHYVFRPPESALDIVPGLKTRIVAAVTDGVDTVKKEITSDKISRQGVEELRIFSRAALQDSILWRIYANDSLTREWTEKPLQIAMEDGNQYARSFGNTPFYPLARTMPASLATAWGFIDSKYALLALEQDSLKASVAQQYAQAGVPALDSGDIFPEEEQLDSIPLSAWMLQRNLDREELLRQVTSIAASGLPAGIRWRFIAGAVVIEIDKATLARSVRVSLHGLDGKLLKAWSDAEIARGRLAWSPREAAYGTGICLLRIVSGQKVHTARVILR